MTPLDPGQVRLTDVGKRYTKYEDTPTLAYGLLQAFKRGRRGKLWAVSDASFDIAPGESVGVIGKNGSGKSTLLQMMCGVTGPTKGNVRVGGRIAPLISVGVGFHPELTGRENIFVNGTILGLTRREVEERLDEIVAFSEIEAFVDTPVKFYSSGMFVRLGFSVAAHVDPDVLLIDEVLAVGDLGFQVKCYEHMGRLRERGCTIVIVSHNMSALEQYCDRGIVMETGHQVFDGPIGEAVGVYYERAHFAGTDAESQHSDDAPLEIGVLEVESAKAVDATGQEASRFEAGETVTLRVDVQAKQAVNAPFLMLTLLSDQGVIVYREYNLFEPYPRLEAGQRTVLSARLPLRVTTGAYSLEWSIGRGNAESREFLQLPKGMASLTRPSRLPLYVKGRNTAHGIADLGAVFEAATTESD